MLQEQPTTRTLQKDESSTWLSISEKLRAEYGDATYSSWLKHLDLVKVGNGEVVLSAPTRFIKEWNRTNYSHRILEHWQQHNNTIKQVDIIIRTAPSSIAKPANVNKPETVITNGIDVSGQNVDVLPVTFHQDTLGSPLDRRFTFDHFVTGKANELALRAAKTVAAADSPIPGINPLYIYGGVGMGKTHLLHATAWHIRQARPTAKICYLSAEKFMFEFVRSLRNRDVLSFKENFRGVDVLLIDDIQFIAGKESTQEEFYHTLNSILSDNKQLIISGDRPPSDIENVREQIRSRLGGGLVVDIQNANYELRLNVLQSKIAQMPHVQLSDDVLAFLATNITSSIRELEGALNKVVAHASLFDREVSVTNVRSMLSDLLRANERTLTIHEIQRKVASYYDIKMADMASARRMRSVSRPRQIAMYLAKSLTTRSLSEIGRKFGGKDHTTVMHAVKRVEELMNNDMEIKDDIYKITQALKQ